jgi:hypothetical protein
MNARLTLVGLSALAASSAFAQTAQIGPDFGIFFPTSRAVRDAFGDTIPDFGFGRTRTSVAGKPSLRTDFGVLTAQRNGNKLLILPFTLQTEFRLTQDENRGGFQPYARLGAGAAYYDYAITTTGGRNAAKTFGLTSSAELGVVFAQRWNLYGKYQYFQRRGGFDFSGVTVGVSLSLLNF